MAIFRRLFGKRDIEAYAIQKPSRLVFARFFEKKLAVAAVIWLLFVVLFVTLGPIFLPIDLSYEESLHVNIAPTYSLMRLPREMKKGAVDIASRSSFTLGLDRAGKVHLWGYAPKGADVFALPEEIEADEIVRIAAGSDHCLALSREGKLYAWGAYDNGQYSHNGTLIASCEKMPLELMGDSRIDADAVVSMAAGSQVSAIVMADGRLYAWGNYLSGAVNLLTFKKEVAEKGIKLAKVVFTDTQIYGLSDDGKLVFGKSESFSRLETVDQDGVRKTYDTLSYIGSRRVVDLEATADSLIVLLDDGEVLWLGSQSDAFYLEGGERARDISAGARHFTVLSSSGRVYAYGKSALSATKVTRKLMREGACDAIFSAGFQNYAYREGKFVSSFGLRGYLFGTDELGRDVLTRVVNGGRMTVTVGAVAVIVAAIIGIIVGCISGYFGGWVDLFLMRVTEIFSAIPFLPFALVMSAILQASDLSEGARIFIIMLVLGVLSWTSLARLLRGVILAEREKEYILSAKASGISEWRIAFRHILPNVVSVILVSLTLDFAACMLTESSLSYLGFGVQPPRPTWGNMLNGCRNATVIEVYWWRWVFPALFLALTVIAINVIGDRLRDIFDPRSEVGR